ncbi:hypothetical protein [Sporichthya brevicatena]
MRITKKKITAVAASAAVVALGAGAAFGYWSSSGTATGSTQLSTMAGLGPATFTIENGLYPGGSVEVVGVSVANTNGFDVEVTSFGTPVFSSDDAACQAAMDGGSGPWFTLSPLPTGMLPFLVQANDTITISGPTGTFLTMVNSADDQNACQGKNIIVSVELTARTA